jgi:UDP-N-acetyl-D-mannosaminuronic acid transferase (WecB/TagA/CpsF family)
MRDSFCLFGIPFQVFSESQLYQLSCDELEKPSLYTIFFVSGSQCNYLLESEEQVRNNQRIAWVPADAALATLFPKKEKHVISEFSIQKYLELLGTYSADTGAEICLLMNTMQQSDIVLKEIRRSFPYLAIHTLNYDSMLSEEAVVNEINSVAPEILILGLHTDEMRHFLERNRKKTNARLCVCVGELLIDEMSKKRKVFHTMTMSRGLRKKLRKYNKREQEGHESKT